MVQIRELVALAAVPGLPLLLAGCGSNSGPTEKAYFDYTWGAN